MELRQAAVDGNVGLLTTVGLHDPESLTDTTLLANALVANQAKLFDLLAKHVTLTPEWATELLCTTIMTGANEAALWLAARGAVLTDPRVNEAIRDAHDKIAVGVMTTRFHDLVLQLATMLN